MKTVQIIAPKGYEVDKEKSTFETIVFKEKHKSPDDWKDFKTFDDLCRAIGTTEVDFNRKWEHADLDPITLAFERLKICTRAYNQDWPFDVYNTDQYKYYPYFSVSSSGLGFSRSDFIFVNAGLSVPAFALKHQRRLFMPEKHSSNFLKIL
jgi:hypothetical protein